MKKNLFWFRRDLRLEDNAGLSNALEAGNTICCFIYDSNILDKLSKDDKRIGFISDSLKELTTKLQKYGSSLVIKYGDPVKLIPQIVNDFKLDEVFANEDYEAYAINRDELIGEKVKLNLYKDHMIFAKDNILKKSGKPYMKYSAYKNAWLKKLNGNFYESYTVVLKSDNFIQLEELEFYDINKQGFSNKSIIKAGTSGAKKRLDSFKDRLKSYNKERNFPILDSTSRLSVDLRFGTVSIRQLVQLALAEDSDGSVIWLQELIWREFFSQILYHFPHVQNAAFKEKYTKLKFENNKDLFKSWCEGKTGFPIIDAGMRQLNETGFMHNRVRLITASFLVKDLLIDWRWGEAYFAEKLLDYELSSNNGNWQWCASTGCDSQPYFRIFNPDLQAARFDKDAYYIKKYVPELKDKPAKLIINTNTKNNEVLNYYLPIVEHKLSVIKAKEMFKSV